MDWSKTIESLGGIDLYKLITILFFGVIFYYIYSTHQNSKEINSAVNHKGAQEPTLREAVMDIREKQAERHGLYIERFDNLDYNLEKLDKEVSKHEKRLTKLEK